VDFQSPLRDAAYINVANICFFSISPARAAIAASNGVTTRRNDVRMRRHMRAGESGKKGNKINRGSDSESDERVKESDGRVNWDEVLLWMGEG